MIRQLLFSLLVIFASLQLKAQEPTALWGKALQTGWQTISNNIQISPDGGLYAIASAGTHEATDDICFGEEKIAPGTKNYGANNNSINKNLVIFRLSAESNVIWTIYSKNADLDNTTMLKTVSDGVIAFFVLRHADKCGGSDVVFVDATGHETTMPWTLEGGNEGNRYYRGVLMKISQDGSILWMRQIVADYQKVQKDKYTQGIYSYVLDVDNEGNIFIGGNFRTALTLLKSDQSSVEIPARHVDGWDGNSQTSVGDLFLIKLDKDGYYQKHLQTDGPASYVSLRSMDKQSGKFYLMGSLIGTENEPVIFGNKQAAPTNGYMTFFTAAVDNNLNVDFFTLYSVEERNFTINSPRVLATNNGLWFLCKAAGTVKTKNGKVLSKGGNTNVGMVMKMDASSGELLDGYVNNVNQAGYFDGFEGNDGKFYAVGNTLLSASYIHQFSMEDLSAPSGTWENLIANTSNGLDIAVTEQGILYTSTTSKITNNTLYGGSKTISQTSEAFSCNLCAFQLPVTPLTGIQTIQHERPADGGIYYNLSGQRVEHPTKGLYIHNGRVVIK